MVAGVRQRHNVGVDGGSVAAAEMSYGGCRMEDIRWRIFDGEYSIFDGGYSMEDIRWRISDGRYFIKDIR